jgi:hypothetical protein
MDNLATISSGFTTRVVLPLLILVALIWAILIGQIMKNLSDPARYVGFAGGFRSVEWCRASGEVKIIFTIVPRRETGGVVHLVKNSFQGHSSECA